MKEEIIIHPKYSFNDYLLPIKQKLIHSWGFYLVLIIALIMLVFDIIFLFNKTIFQNDQIPLFNIIFPVLVLLVFPLFFYFGLKKNFKNNYQLKEKTTIIYNSNGIDTKGESYQSFTTWDKIKSIKEHKKSFTFKNINGQESILPKTFFSNEKLEKFKRLKTDLKL